MLPDTLVVTTPIRPQKAAGFSAPTKSHRYPISVCRWVCVPCMYVCKIVSLADCRRPAPKDNVIICMNSSSLQECNLQCSRSSDHFKWVIEMTHLTHTHYRHRNTQSLTDPHSNSAALKGCTSSQDNPKDWWGLLELNILESSNYYCRSPSLLYSFTGPLMSNFLNEGC